MKKSSFGKEEKNRRCNVFRKGVKGNLSKKCFWVRCTANECFCQKGEIVLSSRIKTDCVASQIGKRASLHPCMRERHTGLLHLQEGRGGYIARK